VTDPFFNLNRDTPAAPLHYPSSWFTAIFKNKSYGKLSQDVVSSMKPEKFLVCIIACLLVAGIPAAAAATETPAPPSVGGTIALNSNPPGAAVSLNGLYRGDTPTRFENLTPGTYVINVSLAGYKPWLFPSDLADGDVLQIGVNLEPASNASATGGSGTIAVDSSPGGASVTLDGNVTGTTPAGRAALILNAVPAGDHTITVELAGYPLYTRNVTVIKNQVVQVNADFVTRSPTISGTPITTTDRREPIPLSPAIAIVAISFAGLAAVFRRS
jgi:hypothetical protein